MEEAEFVSQIDLEKNTSKEFMGCECGHETQISIRDDSEVLKCGGCGKKYKRTFYMTGDTITFPTSNI